MWRAVGGTGIGTERESHGAGEREACTTRPLNAHAPTFQPEVPAHSSSLTASSSIGPSASVVTSFPNRSETRRSPRTPGFTDLTRPAMTMPTQPTLLAPTLPTPTQGVLPAAHPAMVTLAAPTSEMAPHAVLGSAALHGAMPYPSSAALLPQIRSFYGDQKDGETFQDWVEHFEAVGTLAGCFKLVHLTSALKGRAKSFFCSCSPTQRSNY